MEQVSGQPGPHILITMSKFFQLLQTSKIQDVNFRQYTWSSILSISKYVSLVLGPQIYKHSPPFHSPLIAMGSLCILKYVLFSSASKTAVWCPSLTYLPPDKVSPSLRDLSTSVTISLSPAAIHTSLLYLAGPSLTYFSSTVSLILLLFYFF